MKGQAQIFTEFMSFTIGILVMISIAYIFSNYLAPKVINQAMKQQMSNMIEQVDAAASQLLFYDSYFPAKTVSLKISLPNKLGTYDYQLYDFGSDICVSVTSSKYMQCAQNTYNIIGTFTSGSDLVMTISPQRTISITSS